MLIIIEGPDGVGKTTLAEKLAKRIVETGRGEGVELLHRGPPTGHPLDEYVLPLLDYRPEADRHVICDRWHWGEWIYPKILGRTSHADEAVWWYVESFLRSRGALVVRPYVSLDVLTERLLHRGDTLVAAHQLTDLRRAYVAQANASLLSHCTYAVGSNEESALEEIIHRACALEQNAVVVGGVTTYVGSPRPAFVLLGDVRHEISGPDDLRPAFMPYPGTSGHYLLASLLSFTGRRTQQLGIMNACDVDDVETAWHALGHPNLCTLGANAHRAVNLWHSSAPHPQYVRRFHHNAKTAYGQLLDGALATHLEGLKWRP